MEILRLSLILISKKMSAKFEPSYIYKDVSLVCKLFEKGRKKNLLLLLELHRRRPAQAA